MKLKHLRLWIEHLYARQRLKGKGRLSGPVFEFKRSSPTKKKKKKKRTATKTNTPTPTKDTGVSNDEEEYDVDAILALPDDEPMDNDDDEPIQTRELMDEDEDEDKGEPVQRRSRQRSSLVADRVVPPCDNEPSDNDNEPSDNDNDDEPVQRRSRQNSPQGAEHVHLDDYEEGSPASSGDTWASRVKFLRSLSTFEDYLHLVEMLAKREVSLWTHRSRLFVDLKVTRQQYHRRRM